MGVGGEVLGVLVSVLLRWWVLWCCDPLVRWWVLYGCGMAANGCKGNPMRVWVWFPTHYYIYGCKVFSYKINLLRKSLVNLFKKCTVFSYFLIKKY